jgi:crotonobetainyl-CoA:carnitine CoA-transferase CaiB-like acyl-CoA transferase
VYCDIGAFGRAGPLREQPGYDPLMQAFGGLISVTGEPDRPGVRVGASIVDQGTGMWAALGILAALHAGGSRTVDVSLFETAVGLLPYHVTDYLKSGEVPRRYGTAFPLIAPYQVFKARDGELMLAVGNDGLFARLCQALDLPELATNPRFVTNLDRLEHREELALEISAALAERPLAEVLQQLERTGVPAAPVNDVGQVAEHEQTEALGLIQLLPEATVAFPVSFEGERLRHRSPPPRLGEHTEEILDELGYGSEELDRLFASGVIRRVESEG